VEAAPKAGVLEGVPPNNGVLDALGRLAAAELLAPKAGVLEKLNVGVCSA
jgi:hypothetical protein